MMTKQLAIAFGAGVLCTGAVLLVPGFAPEDKKAPVTGAVKEAVKAAPDSMQAEMEQWASLNKLGAEHAKLAKTAGNWDVKASFLMDPSAPAMEGTGTMKSEAIFGGRYIHSKFHMGDFMGMPFDGVACMGYDTVEKQYVSTWIDSMSTGIMMSKGAMSADGKVLTMLGEGCEPDGTKSPMKMVTTFDGDNKFVDQFFKQVDGQWTNTGTITYTRSGASAHAGN